MIKYSCRTQTNRRIDMITIRPYQEKDKEDVRFICLNSEGPSQDSARINNFVLKTYCDYFIEQEGRNCFVAVDENDKAIAYVICAENYDNYYKCFLKEYVPRLKYDIILRMRAIHSSIPQRKFKAEYPAHLHIDVLPEYHRMGIGHKLVDTLCAHLKAKGIKGVMLTTGVDNEKGNGFYKKYGFTQLEVTKGDVAYGLKLL